jgi:hypothetical protein
MALAVLTVLLVVPDRTEETGEEYNSSHRVRGLECRHVATFRSLSKTDDLSNYLSTELPNVPT